MLAEKAAISLRCAALPSLVPNHQEDPVMKLEPLRRRPAWGAREAHHEQVKGVHLRQRFADDPRRGERGRWCLPGILDQSVHPETLPLLVQLASEAVPGAMEAHNGMGSSAPADGSIEPMSRRAP